MKKSFVVTLALVFVLGIAGTAFAANPFVDVPANHWAYASVSKLAAAGIIDGYGDGTFVGSNTMTRYEMAQIVAKAMARSDKADAAMKAQIEKLAAEFANELDSLGVRVAKLEKNADNVKITGEVRFGDWGFDNAGQDGDKDQLRTRLWLRGQVNDNWTYTGMIEQVADLRTNSNDDNTTKLRRAWVDGKLGDFTFTAGRYYYKPVNGLVFDEDADGAKLTYKKDKFAADLFYMRPSFMNPTLYNDATGKADKNQVFGAVIGYDFSKNFNLKAAYYSTDRMNYSTLNDVDIWEVAVAYQFSKDFGIWAEYLRGDEDIADGGKSGWAVRADYGKMNRSKAGTFNIHAGYYDQPASTIINSTHELDMGDTAAKGGAGALFDGYKGWKAGIGFMAAKNIDLNFEYYDFETQNTNVDNKLYWSYVRFYF